MWRGDIIARKRGGMLNKIERKTNRTMRQKRQKKDKNSVMDKIVQLRISHEKMRMRAGKMHLNEQI